MSDKLRNLEDELPYGGEVLDLYRKEAMNQEPTFAYARLGSELLLTLAKTGRIQGLCATSIVPGAFEYKLTAWAECANCEDFDNCEECAEDFDPLDDPLRPNDLKRAIGITKLPFVVEELKKLGMQVEKLTPKEVSDLVRYLEDPNTCRSDFGGKHSSEYNGFVALAENLGLDIEKLKELSKVAESNRGFLVGLSKDFLNRAGDDVWPENRGIGTNHPCVYSNVFPHIDDITEIIPLDEEAKKIMRVFGADIEKDPDGNKETEDTRNQVVKSLGDLGINI